MHEMNRVFLTPLSRAEIHAFQVIERQQAGSNKERYALIPRKNAFVLRGGDVLQLLPTLDDMKIEKEAEGVRIDRAGEESVILDSGAIDFVEEILDELRTPQTYACLQSSLSSRCDSKTIKNICEELLGVCLEAPGTIAALERELPLNGLLRFPLHSPYRLPRAYWENSIAVRRALPLLYESCSSTAGFVKAISGLHRLATMGESGENIYGGAGGLPTAPGVYRQQDIKTGVAPWCLHSLEWWLKDLEVPAKLVKRGTIQSIGKRSMVEISMDGVQCMHLYEADGQLVFKLMDEARNTLRAALQSANTKDVDAVLSQLARFLQLFSLAHPFNNINASIAMNIVNDILEKQELGRLPHLYLDYVAQRTLPGDFSLIFKAIFDQHRFTGSDEIADAVSQENMKRLVEAAASYLEAQRIAFVAARQGRPRHD